MLPHDHETKSRLLAKLVRELLASEQFETLADLTDALKVRCSRLKILHTPSDVSDAFRVIASNTALAAPPAGLERRVDSTPLPLEDVAMPAPEARRIYAEIMARYRQEQPANAETRGGECPPDFPNLVRA